MFWRRKYKMLEKMCDEETQKNIDAENTINDLRNTIKEQDNKIKELESDIDDGIQEIEKLYTEITNIGKIYTEGIKESNKKYDTLVHTYEVELDRLKDITDKEIQNTKSAADTSKAIAGIIASQQSSIAALAEGIYNQEHIEFFALKTYRGWKYICVNGQKITDFDNVNNINIVWNKNDNRLNVNIK